MQVHLYGILTDLAGARSLALGPDVTTGDALRDYLSRQHPPMAEVLARPSTRLLLDHETADWQASLASASDIAIIPMVSGG
jgi:molybdopterin converting factor small subunit